MVNRGVGCMLVLAQHAQRFLEQSSDVHRRLPKNRNCPERARVLHEATYEDALPHAVQATVSRFKLETAKLDECQILSSMICHATDDATAAGGEQLCRVKGACEKEAG